MIDDIILQTMDEYGYGMEITNPTKQRTNRRNEDVYVDDAALGVDGRDDWVTERLGEDPTARTNFLCLRRKTSSWKMYLDPPSMGVTGGEGPFEES